MSIQNLDQISDDGFAQAERISGKPCWWILEVYLTKCIGLGDKAIYELFKHSGHIGGIKYQLLDLLTKNFLSQVFTEDLHHLKKDYFNNWRKQDEEVEYYNHKASIIDIFGSGICNAVDNELFIFDW